MYIFGDARKPYRHVIWELCNNGKPAAHSLDVSAKSGNQDVRALLQSGHTILVNSKFARNLGLSSTERLAQLLARHFFCDQRMRPCFNFVAPTGR